MLSKRALADIALVFCSLIWGCTFLIVKNALGDISVMAYIAVRFCISGSLMGIIFWRSLRELKLPALWAGVQIGFFMLGGYVFQTTGLKFTTPSKAAFITGSSVVLVPLFLAPFGQRRIKSWLWAGAIAALAGLYFLTVPSEGLGELNKGDPIVFVCAVMFAMHMIFLGRYVARHPVGAISFLQVATTGILAAFLVPVFAIGGLERPHISWTTNLISALAITSIGSTVIGFSLQTWAQKYTSASHTAILVSMEPVFAAITAWVVSHEHLGRRGFLGAALILAGILLAELKGPSPGVPESPSPPVTSGNR